MKTQRPDKNINPPIVELLKTKSSNDKLIQVGNIKGGYGYVKHDQSNRVYSEEGICPTLSTRYDDYQTGFKILVKRRY